MSPRSAFERRAFAADHVRSRRTAFTFPDDVPQYWVAGRPGRTHLMNALHLFLPPFERMIVRVVRSTLPNLEDPAQARGFIAQEATHGRAHELFHRNLRLQGYSIDRWLRVLEWWFGRFFERFLGTKLTLAMVAAFEHYTDLLVPLVLESDFLDGCEPRLRELLEWHAAEEIEHNAVAFALLEALDDGALLRFVGNVLGLSVIVLALTGGALLLAWQDRTLFERRTLADFGAFFFGRYRIGARAVRLFVAYARPGYAPDEAFAPLARTVLDP